MFTATLNGSKETVACLRSEEKLWNLLFLAWFFDNKCLGMLQFISIVEKL